MLYELTLPSVPVHNSQTTATANCISPVQQKDYSRPLHVDCSVEYELPSQVKPPPPTNGKIDPLLMIHPCYFRKIEAQRRSPFINNLPNRGVNVSSSVTGGSTNSSTTAAVNNNNRCTTNRIVSVQQNPQPVPQPVVCHSRPVKTQQQQQPYPVPQHYQQQQHGWPTETTAVGTVNKHHHQHHHHHHHHHQLPSCAAGYSTTLEGGLWTNTNHSPLAAERFPEPQVTLHQIQPTITATTTDNINANSSTASTAASCSKNHILATGKYRQYLRTHRLHPYMSMATTAFPQFTQMQQISCYNV